MITQEAVVLTARSWVGVPFRHQGRSRDGVDCVGLPIVIGAALGVFPPSVLATDMTNYGRLPTGEIIERLREYRCAQLEAPRPAALIVIAWQRLAAHIAVCTGPTMIHAYESVGRVVEHGYRGRWLRLTHSVWALPGVAA